MSKKPCNWCESTEHTSFQCFKKPRKAIAAKPCKICGSVKHTPLTCPSRPRAAIKVSNPTPLKRTPIKQIGKYTRKWLEFRTQWLKDHPPNERGNYICYICKDDVWYTEVTLDHIISRSRAPELRFVESNIAPCCAPCNTEKGSMGLEEFLAKKGLTA